MLQRTIEMDDGHTGCIGQIQLHDASRDGYSLLGQPDGLQPGELLTEQVRQSLGSTPSAHVHQPQATTAPRIRPAANAIARTFVRSKPSGCVDRGAFVAPLR